MKRVSLVVLASFVGTANLIRGTVAGGASGSGWVELESGRVRIKPGTGLPPLGSAVTLCLRPEAIEAMDRRPENMENVIPGRVRTRMAGRELVVDVTDPASKGMLEENVFLRLPAERIHIIPEVDA